MMAWAIFNSLWSHFTASHSSPGSLTVGFNLSSRLHVLADNGYEPTSTSGELILLVVLPWQTKMRTSCNRCMAAVVSLQRALKVQPHE